MDHAIDLDELQEHQRAVLELIDHCIAVIDAGQATVLARSPELRPRLVALLTAYQKFKHGRIFDPAIASGDEQRAVLARHMKIACLAAGQIVETHVRQWKPDRIRAEWDQYLWSVRLSASQLRRHIVTERDGIAELIRAYGLGPAPAARQSSICGA